MKTLIAIPCLDQLDVNFVRSLTSLHRVGTTYISFMTNSLVYDARNKLAQQAIDENADFILWFDSDMVFSESLMQDMFRSIEGRDFVTAVCHRRRPPFSPCIYKTIRMGIAGDNISEEYIDYPTDAPFEIDACGFGAVLMRVDMLKTVLHKDNALFNPLSGYGEDISFCIRAKRAGYKLFCDPKVQVGHVARSIVTADTFKAYRSAHEVQ